MAGVTMFELAQDLAPRIDRLGAEMQPLLVMDRLMARPEALVDYACTQVGFAPAGTTAGGYPGLSAPAPIAYAKAVGLALDPLIRDAFDLRNVRPKHASCRFSLVTTAPEALTPLQRVPHIDTVDPLQFALLHYLCGPEYGGTDFFRHRATGFETIDAERAMAYDAARDAALLSSPPPPAYCAGDSLEFARIGGVSAWFDRLIVYRSCLLHSGVIPSAQLLSANPRKGRLTANIFITYR